MSSDTSDSDEEEVVEKVVVADEKVKATTAKRRGLAAAVTGLVTRLTTATTTTTRAAAPASPRALIAALEASAAQPTATIVGRRQARPEPVEFHRVLVQALFVEAENWRERNIGVSVDFDEDPQAQRPPRTGLVNGAGHVRTNANPRLAESSRLRQYEFYPNAIECAAFAANQSHFPLGLIMGTDVQSTHFFANAPLLSAADTGAGTEAMLLAAQVRFQALWRNIIRHNVASPAIRHLRVLGVSFKCGDAARLSADERERQLFHAHISITLMAETHSPEAVEALTNNSSARQDAKQRQKMRTSFNNA